MNNTNYYILLYYCYTPIENPEEFREKHHFLCLTLNLRGRIILSSEGINGTLSGLKPDCEKYMHTIKTDPRFSNIDFKIQAHDSHAFNKLHVRYKPEIVHSGIKTTNFNKRGSYISPKDLKRFMNQKDFMLLDVRSNYEHQMGKFKQALTLNISHFREFPQRTNELMTYKEKKIITYCTGGVRCEKASAYLLEKRFKNVYQLHGGIIKYGFETDGEDFEGSCYVFDNRIKRKINTTNSSVISRCYVCNGIDDNMVNCANADCNRHIVICKKCMVIMEGVCSKECKTSPHKRPYNMKGYYPAHPNGYNPYKCAKRNKS